jgi:hypothetical protein
LQFAADGIIQRGLITENNPSFAAKAAQTITRERRLQPGSANGKIERSVENEKPTRVPLFYGGRVSFLENL